MATSQRAPKGYQMPITPPLDQDPFVPLPKPVVQGEMSTSQGQQQPQTQPSQQPAQQPEVNTQTQAQPQPTPNPMAYPYGPSPPLHDPSNNPIDPRFLTMASQLSAYYQQQCQVMANNQQKKYQAWANMYRQKTQDMMRGTMLVAAWYIRDRIRRRQRRETKRFRRRLSRCAMRPKIAKGQRVKKWVSDVPSDVISPNEAGYRTKSISDKEEEGFSMDKEDAKDENMKLFAVADKMIKSHMGRINIPILGALDLGESESSSESKSEEELDYDDEDYDDDEEEMGYAGSECEYGDDESDGYDTDGVEERCDESGPKGFQMGTGKVLSNAGIP